MHFFSPLLFSSCSPELRNSEVWSSLSSSSFSEILFSMPTRSLVSLLVAPVACMLLLSPVQAAPLTIAFGSCIGDPHAPIFSTIAQGKPDYFLLVGDAIYPTKDEFKDPARYRALLLELLNHPPLASLRSRHALLALWDDNDVGPNDHDAGNPFASITHPIFRELFEIKDPDVPGTIARSLDFGRVQLLLTDNRSQRWEGPPPHHFGPEQIRWIKTKLRRPDIDVTLIASGNQLLAQGAPLESLLTFPEEYRRLTAALEASEHTTLILSGDRHLAEILRHHHAIEVTSSPLAGYGRSNFAPAEYARPDAARIAGPILAKNNFGIIVVDNRNEPRRVRAEIRDEDDKVLLAFEAFHGPQGSEGSQKPPTNQADVPDPLREPGQ